MDLYSALIKKRNLVAHSGGKLEFRDGLEASEKKENYGTRILDKIKENEEGPLSMTHILEDITLVESFWTMFFESIRAPIYARLVAAERGDAE